MTTLHDLGGVLGRPLDTFLLGSHNFMVTALGSCVKWPQASETPKLNLQAPACQKSASALVPVAAHSYANLT